MNNKRGFCDLFDFYSHHAPRQTSMGIDQQASQGIRDEHLHLICPGQMKMRVEELV